MNKWDTIPNKKQETATYYEQDVREKMRMLDWAPIVYSTAIAGQSVEKYVFYMPYLVIFVVTTEFMIVMILYPLSLSKIILITIIILSCSIRNDIHNDLVSPVSFQCSCNLFVYLLHSLLL